MRINSICLKMCLTTIKVTGSSVLLLGWYTAGSEPFDRTAFAFYFPLFLNYTWAATTCWQKSSCLGGKVARSPWWTLCALRAFPNTSQLVRGYVLCIMALAELPRWQTAAELDRAKRFSWKNRPRSPVNSGRFKDDNIKDYREVAFGSLPPPKSLLPQYAL